MGVKNIFIALASCLLLLFLLPVEAFAEIQLPEGAVKGLPERLAALDDEGNAVNSATGEYFFHVENMQYGQTYSKNVQLMNLREDSKDIIFIFTLNRFIKPVKLTCKKAVTANFSSMVKCSIRAMLMESAILI